MEPENQLNQPVGQVQNRCHYQKLEVPWLFLWSRDNRPTTRTMTLTVNLL